MYLVLFQYSLSLSLFIASMHYFFCCYYLYFLKKNVERQNYTNTHRSSSIPPTEREKEREKDGERDTDRDHSCFGSLWNLLQQHILGQAIAKDQGFHVVLPGGWPSTTALPHSRAHEQKAGLEAEQPGLELAIWYAIFLS